MAGDWAGLQAEEEHTANWRSGSAWLAAETPGILVTLELPEETSGVWSNEAGKVGRGRAWKFSSQRLPSKQWDSFNIKMS